MTCIYNYEPAIVDMADPMDGTLWQKREVVKKSGVWTVEGRPRSTYSSLERYEPSNIPGMSIVNLLVTLPPGAATPPHTHNGAALTATVVSGKVYSQMIHPHTKTKADGTTESVQVDSGVGVYGIGETWFEAPECHHVRSDNASEEEDAKFVVNFVIETEKLTRAEKEYGDIGRALTILDVDMEAGGK